MSELTLRVCPGRDPSSWEEFCATHEAYAIALDGYVAAGPRFDGSGPRLNLDHHSEVDRLATRATCAQAFLAVRQGLFDRFRDEKGPRATVYVNDCDEDVCTSWLVLSNSHLVTKDERSRLERLVNLVDVLDTTAGACLHSANLSELEELAWVFSPYHSFRQSGELDRRNATAYRGVVDEVAFRIGRHLDQRGDSRRLDGRYRRLGGGPGWAMIREVGPHARLAVVADGIRAYVSVRERSDGRWAYVLGRTSPFVPFDIPVLVDVLNEVEGLGGLGWGGGNLVAGSPRVQGSKLSPSALQRILNGLLDPRPGKRQEHHLPWRPVRPSTSPAAGVLSPELGKVKAPLRWTGSGQGAVDL